MNIANFCPDISGIESLVKFNHFYFTQYHKNVGGRAACQRTYL